jgi:TP901 family phage tail tape measure protein
MADLGVAKVRLEADDSRLVATLAQIPAKLASALGQAENRAKTQSSAAGAQAGAAFTQGYLGTIRSSASTVSAALSAISTTANTAMSTAGTQSGQRFSQSLAAAVSQGAAGFNTAVAQSTSAAQATAAAAGTRSGQSFSQSLAAAVSQGSSGFGSAVGQATGSGEAAAAAAGTQSGRAYARTATESARSGLAGAAGNVAAPFRNTGEAIAATLRRSLSNVGRGVGERIGQNITDGLMGVTRKIGGALLDTKNVVDYDAAVRQIQTLKGDTAGFIQAAKDITKELGNNANQVDALNSLYDVMSSGVTKAADAQKVLSASIKLSTTTNSDLAENQQVVLGIMNAYSMSADKAEEITNKLFGTVNAGVVRGKELAQSFGGLTSTAAAAGVQLDESLTLIGVATLKAVKPAEAITGIRSLVDSFTGLTKDGKAAVDRLGVRFDALALKAKGPIAIIKELEAKGATSQDFADIFSSSEARKVVNTVRGKEGTEMVQTVRATINTTSVDEQYANVAAGFAIREKALQNKLKDLDINLKTGAVGAILAQGFEVAGKAIDGFVSGLEKLNTWYNQATPQTKSFVNTIGGIAAIGTGVAVALTAISAAFAFIVPAFLAGVGAIGAFASGAAILATAVAPIAIPLIAVGAAVYGLAKAFGATNTQAFTASLVAVGVGLAAVFGPALISAVGAAAAAVVTGLGAMAVAASAALIPFLPWIAAAAGVAAALYGLYKVFELAKPTLDKWANAIANAAKAAWDGVGKFVTNTGAALAKWASDFGAWIKPALDWFGRLVVSVGELVGAIVSKLAQLAVKVAQPMIDFVATISKFIAKMALDGLAIAGKFISDFIKGFTDFSIKLGNVIGTAFVKIVQTIAGAFTQIMSDIGNFISSALSAIVGFVGNVLAAFGRWLQSIPIVSAAIKGLQDVIKFLGDVATGVFNGVVKIGVWMGEQLVGAFNNIVNSIKSAIDWLIKLPETLSNAAKSIAGFNGTQIITPAPQGSGGADPIGASLPGRPSPVADTASRGNQVLVAADLSSVSDSGGGVLAGAFGRQAQSVPFKVSSPVPGLSLEQAISYQGLPVQRPEASRSRRRNGGRAIERHSAVDYGTQAGVTLGSPVSAAFAGTARYTDAGIYGARVILDGVDQYGTKIRAEYLHLGRESAKYFTQGARQVKAGEIIGNVGTQGKVFDDGTVTGNEYHLDFATYVNDIRQPDPRKFLTDLAAGAIEATAGKPEPVVQAATRINLYGGGNPSVVTTDGVPRRYISRVGGAASGPGAGLVESPPPTATPPQRRLLQIPGATALGEPTPGKATTRNTRARTNAERNLAEANQALTEAESSNGRGRTVRGSNRRVVQAQRRVEKAERVLEQARESKNRKRIQSAENNLQNAQESLRNARENSGATRERSASGRANRVAKAQERVRKAQERLAQTEEKGADSQRSDAVARVQGQLDTIGNQAALENANIDRDVAEGRVSKGVGDAQKADILRQQSAALDAIKPQLEQLRAQYPDAETAKSISTITQSIQQQGAAAANAATELAKVPVAELSARVETLISNAAGANAETDAAANRTDTTTTKLSAAIEKAQRLEDLAKELESAVQEADGLNVALQDPESAKALDAIRAKIRDVGIEAAKARQDAGLLAIGQVTEKVTAATGLADRATQGIETGALNGDISPEERETALLNIRRLTSEQMSVLLVQMESLRNAQTDPAIIETANEQIAKMQRYIAETNAATRANEELKRQSELGYQTAKAVAAEVMEAFETAFKSALKGGKDLGSVLDGLLNKLADIGIDMLYKAAFGGFNIGKIFGLKTGGEVQNFATGGEVFGAIQAVNQALRKEGPDSVLAALTPGEQVLDKRIDAPVYRAMVADGTWERMRSAYNYSSGGAAGGVGRTATASKQLPGTSGSSGKPSVAVSEINGAYYVSYEELRGILDIEIPMAANAGAAKTEQNMRRTTWRQQYGLRG